MTSSFIRRASTLLLGTFFVPNLLASYGQTGDPPDIVPEGVTVDYLAQAMPEIQEGAGLAQFRVTFAAGAAVPAWYLPGMAVLTVESGYIRMAVVKGPITVVSPGTGDQADRAEDLANDPNQPDKGAVADLLAGDFAFMEMGGVISVRSERDEPAVLLVSAVVNPGEPLIRFTADPRAPATPKP